MNEEVNTNIKYLASAENEGEETLDALEDFEEFIVNLADEKKWHRRGGACRWLRGNWEILQKAQELVVKHGLDS
jgi:hypothetical protein